MIKKIDKQFKKYPPLDTNTKITDSSKYSRNNFFKVDIDNNGLTDLIIYGYQDFFVVLDMGRNGYSIRSIEKGALSFNPATLILIDTSATPTKVLIQQTKKSKVQFDTLVYKFDDFIEYNSNPMTDFEFTEIHFKTERCFGTCPVFEMTVNKNRIATYKAVEYNDEAGEFKGMISQAEFDELMSLLKYINLDKLNNEYSVNWTDDQPALTEIHYNNTVKIINDYGKIGTFGLSNLYAKFFNWRKSVQWTE